MAPSSGRTDRSVIDDLLAQPREFTFFQAVRLLDRGGETGRIGQEGPPRRERLRFRPWNSMAFPVADIEEVEEEENPWGGDPKVRYALTSCFLGLYGTTSPLPDFYTEYLIREDETASVEDKQRLRAFLDLFHHRYFSFVYRCLSKYRHHLVFEASGADTFSGDMLCLIGRGTRGMPQDRPISPVRMLHYAGLLTQQPKSAQGLRGVLSDFFDEVSVAVEQCVGRWFSVEDFNQLGRGFCSLGSDLVVGAKVYDRSGKFRVSLGPMGLGRFLTFLPAGSSIKELEELVRLYVLDELEFDMEIWLRGNEVPPLVLGGQNPQPLLGWTTWLAGGPEADRSVVFHPAA